MSQTASTGLFPSVPLPSSLPPSSPQGSAFPFLSFPSPPHVLIPSQPSSRLPPLITDLGAQPRGRDFTTFSSWLLCSGKIFAGRFVPLERGEKWLGEAKVARVTEENTSESYLSCCACR